MQPSIPFNSPSAIGICFGDSTRATCFRRRAAAEFREARMQDARARKGEPGRGRKRPFDCIVRPQWKLFRKSLPTQFALSRMTLPGFLVAILELDTYLPQYGSSRTTRLACLPQNHFLIFFRFVRRLLPHSRNSAEPGA